MSTFRSEARYYIMEQVGSSHTDADLVQLISQHQVGVWRYLRALGCDAPLAEDLTQETFLAILQKPFENYDFSATASYLRTVARNLLITHRRRENPHLSVEEWRVEDWQQVEQTWARWVKGDNADEMFAALADCFEKLDERAQQALKLRYTEKKSRVEIAEQLELSPDGAKNLLQRTKKALRECISKKLD